MKKVIDERRLGVFSLSHEYIFEAPDVALDFLSNMLIIRAEFLVELYGIEFTAYSKLFEPVARHNPASKYSVKAIYKVIDDEGNKEIEKLVLAV